MVEVKEVVRFERELKKLLDKYDAHIEKEMVYGGDDTPCGTEYTVVFRDGTRSLLEDLTEVTI